MITLNASSDPLVSVLILCQDNLDLLKESLASIAATLDYRDVPFEVLVLFQQTSRYSVRAFSEQIRGVRATCAELNLGFAGGNNLLATGARGKYLVFLNDDATVQNGWLHHLVRLADRDERIGAVGSCILFPDGRLQEAGAIIWSDGSAFPLGRGLALPGLSYSYVRPVDYASANGLLVRRQSFEAVGGFDERFFPAYYEDADLCMKIRHTLGQRIMYQPQSRIVHRESVTANRDPRFRAFLFHRHQQLFCEKWSSELAQYPAPEPDLPAAVESAIIRARGNPKRALVIDDRVPRPGIGSGFGRTLDLLQDLSQGEFAVSFMPTDRGQLPFDNALADLGVDLITDSPFEHPHVTSKGYDVVIVSRPHNFSAYYQLIRKAWPAALIIYDAEALYHRRLLLQSRIEGDFARCKSLEAEADAMYRLEMEIAVFADRIVAISDSEVEWFESIDGHAPVDFRRPLGQNITLPGAGLEKRSGAVFVAGWLAGDASPNVGALRWYALEVVPRVRAAVPAFVTLVTGSNPPLSVQSLACDGISLAGFVESVESVYRGARVAIAPILAGAGVKIKTIEALQYGVPVVATTVGAEGLGLTDGEEIDTTDDPAEYANRLITLLCNDAVWNSRREKFTLRIAQWESKQVRWSELVTNALKFSQENAASTTPC